MRQLAALPLLSCLLSVAWGAVSARADGAAPAATLPVATCLARLDAAAADAARAGRERRARKTLSALAERCPHLPQIHHDLGVLAAREERLPEAYAHFERALASDPRAGATVDQLRALHRREAALGYAHALGTAVDAPPPRLVLQDSRDVGADTLRARAARDDALHDVSTLEYELYDWWRSADDDDSSRLAHYVYGYSRRAALAGRERDAAIPWESVRREIALTAEDAVAVIEHPVPGTAGGAGPVGKGGDASAAGGTSGEGATLRRLLLLRLEGERWKIYRESVL